MYRHSPVALFAAHTAHYAHTCTSSDNDTLTTEDIKGMVFFETMALCELKETTSWILLKSG